MTTRGQTALMRTALDLAALAAECRSMEDLRTQLLPGLADATDSHLALYHQISLAGSPQEYGLGWPLDPASMVTALRGYPPVMEQSPLLQHFRARGAPGIVSVSQLMSQRQWRANPVYVESHGPLGIDDHLALLLTFHPRATHGVTLARDGHDYTAEDRQLLELVAPHLRSATRRALGDPAPYRTIRTLPLPTEVWRTGPALAPDEPAPRLTQREREVLAVIAGGHGVRRAARELGIAERTVEKHLENVYRKVGASSYVEAMTLLRADRA